MKEDSNITIIDESESAVKAKVIKRMIKEYGDAGVSLCILGDVVSQRAFEGKLHTDDLDNLIKVVVGSKSDVFVYAGIMQNITNEDGIIFPKLNEFDKTVYEAVGSIYEFGNSQITFHQIARLICQKDGINNRDNIIKDIEMSLTKMLSFLGKIDLKKEAEKHNIPIPEKMKGGYMVDQLLSGRIISIKLNNNVKVGGIELRAEPFLFSYVKWKAKGYAQFLRVAPLLFKNNARKTPKRVSLEHYVVERIEKMKRAKKISRLITYTALMNRLEAFSNVDTNNANSAKSTKQRIQRDMTSFLDSLKDKGEITGHSADIRKGQLYGWKIHLDDEN